jgi:hypothetical protein
MRELWGTIPAKVQLQSLFGACKIADFAFIPFSAASFVITPLVPGFSSLDVKPHSPGGTRRSERKSKNAERRSAARAQSFLNS